MELNVAKEIAALGRMTVGQLRDRYADVFAETTVARNKDWLIKRIAWRLQANVEGGLSERARRRAAELANDADLRLTAPREQNHVDLVQVTKRVTSSSDIRLPAPGTVITRDYKGRTLEVTVRDNGFEFEGEVYKSLSAVAKAVTGTHWNGYHFFALRKKGPPK